MCKYKHDLCVQVKNKPIVEFTVIMRLIPWIHFHGGETGIIELKIFRRRSSDGFLHFYVSCSIFM
jgi:hypothetical protein